MDEFLKSFAALFKSEDFRKRFQTRNRPLYAATFRAFGNEPDTSALETQLIHEGFEVAYPAVRPDFQMDFYRARLDQADDWKVSSLFAKVLEPARQSLDSLISPGAFDLILIPGRQFDVEGGRKGRGKGYYDRYLARAPQALRIGVLSHEDQIQSKSLPLQPWDIKMDFLLLPDRWLKVG
jgi:5,10-methenyltetrahydrofolate synthetase